MKAFAIYTLLRLALFLACLAVVGVVWYAVFGRNGIILIPVIAAAVISSVLSLRLLEPQREAFARSVQARAERASANFEQRRAREDEPDVTDERTTGEDRAAADG